MPDKNVVPQSDVDPEVERHVEQIMDPSKPDPVAAGSPPPIDIFGGKAPVETVPEPAPEPASAQSVQTEPVTDAPKTPLDDAATDAAVDSIAARESDEVMAIEDAKQRGPGKKSSSFKDRLKRLFSSRKTWIIVAAVIVILGAVPFTRYTIAGLVVRKTVHITVVDSKTGTPVSSALVNVSGRRAETDPSGKVTLRLPVGSKTLTVSKQYYVSNSVQYMVGFRSPAPARLKLKATGRPVPLTVVNKITGQPLANVEVSVLKTKAKTNAKGQTTVVLPADASTDNGTLTLSGYNTASVAITVTGKDVAANHLGLTPVGKLYFLSNQSGKIDVVKTNLDGSDRQTVLAGTGNEDPNDTNLLASRDWKFLVLKARRNSPQAGLYLIDTSNDKLTQFDSSAAVFTLIGFHGHNFLYDLQSGTVPLSQGGHELIKSYNADALQLNQLDSNVEQGTADSYAYQSFSNFYLVPSGLIYTVQWYTYDNTGVGYDVSSLNDFIRGIGPTGQNKKDYQALSATTSGYIQATLAAPDEVYFGVYNYGTNKNVYYEYKDQSVHTDSDISDNSFQQNYPTYLISPSGQKTFWTDLRDGKHTLFIGDENATGQHALTTDGSYTPYGWFTENYLLVSKNSSELYIMPVSGLKTSKAPLKITDYYKSPQSFLGYGYGYGGL
jgi:hypothetical protein